MSENTFERRIEENITSQLSAGAEVVGAVAGGLLRHARSDEEEGREGFLEVVLYAAKVKAVDTLRRMIRP
jgi:hypothetical protein